MKSTKENLISRGFIEKGAEKEYLDISFEDKIKLLKSQIPSERALGGLLLSTEKKAVNELLNALKKEDKLYARLEISNALSKIGQPSVIPLIEELGKIGLNQHKLIPEKEFEKNSYPLPRDIAARVIIRIGNKAIPILVNSLDSITTSQLSEAIDAIGYICFYDYQDDVFDVLKELYFEHHEKDLIRWKFIRAFSAFPESLELLIEEMEKEQNSRIKNEIKRSIILLN